MPHYLRWICPVVLVDVLAKEMISEVMVLCNNHNSYKITVMCFDTGIYNVDTFTHDDGRDIRVHEPPGGGGTEFDVVWKYMEQEGIEA